MTYSPFENDCGETPTIGAKLCARQWILKVLVGLVIDWPSA
jgi:hypothetical protein